MSLSLNQRVLVLGSDTRSFLSVVRSLGRMGLEVHGAWISDDSPSKHSRFLRQVHHVAPPWRTSGEQTVPDEQWIDDLNQLMSTYSYDLVIPTSDAGAIALRESRASVKEFGKYYILRDQTFEIVNSKEQSSALAEKLGIPVPQRRLIESDIDLSAAIEELGLPLVLKPLASFTSERLDRKLNVQVVTSEEAARGAHATMIKHGPIQGQEFFSGVGTGVEFLARNGNIHRVFQHLRLHEPPNGGGSSYRKSIPLHSGMLQAATRLIHELNYTGVGMVEFLWDPETDRWRFVEINGRFWGSLPLAIASKADFPADLYKLICRGENDFSQRYRCGVHSRNLTADKNWHSHFLRSVELSWLQKAKQCFGELAGAAGRIVLMKEKVDTFSVDDSKPFFVESFQMVSSMKAGLSRRRRIRSRESARARMEACKALQKRLNAVGSVLFLCKGNICRSPFAEHYFRHIAEGTIQIQSAGYFPKTGRVSPEAALQAAERKGISMQSHRSRIVDHQMFDNSDLILVFDHENYDYVANHYPSFKPKLFFVNHLIPEIPLEISDPYGGTVSRFTEIYQQIKKSIDEIVVAQRGTPSRPIADAANRPTALQATGENL